MTVRQPRIVALGAILAAAAGLLWLRLERHASEPPAPPPMAPSAAAPNDSQRISPELAAEWAAIEARERGVEATLWAGEMEADRHGRMIERFWDALNASIPRLSAAAALPFRELRAPAWEPPEAHPLGISFRPPSPSPRAGTGLDPAAWQDRIRAALREGWILDRVEFRHRRFDAGVEGGRKARSGYAFTAHLTQAPTRRRGVLEGPVEIEWGSPAEPGGPPIPDTVDASQVSWRSRVDVAGLEPILEREVSPVRHAFSIDPLIVQDLDGDGTPEILLIGANEILRFEAPGGFRSSPLRTGPPRPVAAAVLGDLDGDGQADLLVATLAGLEFVAGTPSGTFPGPARTAWSFPPDVRHPQALACGDVDRDGDLDVFLAQYRTPYDGGSMPTPFHDARDGYPAYLLLNDGRGRFRDVTAGSGLEAKRRRRTYAASFADLDGDACLDLVVTSDFAGVDVHRGNGRGGFVEVTSGWISEPHAFGMAHALTDFDRDGRLDLLVMGMTSATASRLDHLQAWRVREGVSERLRGAMTHGSRLYQGEGNAGPGFRETPLGASIADTGWSWGCGEFDLDSDGFPEVYIATGHETRTTVRDYDREYWLHDAFVGGSEESPGAYLYFRSKFSRTRGRGESYGGPERNRLYWNREGKRFEEVAHLFGVALDQDSRNVVPADLDGDGRMDLIVTHADIWPSTRQFLRIYRNTLSHPAHWIGVRLPRRSGADVLGAVVRVRWAGRESVRTVAAGTSYRSQSPPTVHFGLGASAVVEELRVRWPDGRESRQAAPAVDRYHEVAPP